jgi:hypothetical protein
MARAASLAPAPGAGTEAARGRRGTGVERREAGNRTGDEMNVRAGFMGKFPVYFVFLAVIAGEAPPPVPWREFYQKKLDAVVAVLV